MSAAVPEISMNPADPYFSKVPIEVLLLILRLIPDLPSLRNLDKTSPSVSSLFEEYGAEITESIISHSLPAQIQNLIRTVILVRSKLIPSRSLEDFTAVFLRRDGYCLNFVNGPNYTRCIRRIHPSLSDSLEACEACREAFPPLGISKETSSVILRGIMATACRIQNLADELLLSSMDRCMASKPLQLVDQKFRYAGRAGFKWSPQRRPLGKSFTPVNHSGSSFSWIEQQRTNRQFWRLQLFLDLKKLGKRKLLCWPVEDLARLDRLDVSSFWSLENFNYRVMEQLGTVADYLASRKRQHGITALEPTTSFHSLVQVPVLSSFAHSSWSIPSILSPYALDESNEAENIMSSEIGMAHRPNTPLRYTSWSQWRKFGFYIWDDERMRDLGFLFRETHSEDSMRSIIQSFSEDDMYFRWESILDQDVINAYENRRLGEFELRVREYGSTGRRESYWAESR
ncbi:hypothetical protein BKA61DRAFT_625033 [Leptodontidium sp. MPI-SDFR-AT-0119]|nr:hypothetical protein BKA61DRAFT_625033 [Leptodontidium sp. MPI-SDFR-AT-0119]